MNLQIIKFNFYLLLFLLVVTACEQKQNDTMKQETTSMQKSKAAEDITDTLPSWNNGENKKKILDFVKRVTDKNSNEFMKEEDRIAVFDNDGTLWVEQPVYSQFLFALDKVNQLAPQHPEWKQKEPFKSILEGNMKSAMAGGEKAVMEILKVSHAGMTTEEFSRSVKEWIDTARHPHFKKPYTKCIYKPMLELIQYLRANGFKTYIVSGGGIEFIRPWVQQTYGIPPDQVIGSRIKTRYEIQNGKPVLVRLPEADFIDDKEGKPVGINEQIGRPPLAAFGNSDGDFQMLEWTTAGKNLSFGLIVHHDDAEREFAYDRQSMAGKLDKGLNEAAKRGWVLVSMKNDWKRIFPD